MVAASNSIHTCSMQERAAHRDFEIEREGATAPLDRPYRHEYFETLRPGSLPAHA